MSAALIDREPVIARRRMDARSQARTRRTRTKSQAKSRARLESMVMARTIEFVLIFSLVYAASALIGHCLMESARRDQLVAAERTRKVRLDVARLRDEVSRLKSMGEIDSWALSRGFVPHGGALREIPNHNLHVARR